jgi:hypothetical protein
MGEISGLLEFFVNPRVSNQSAKWATRRAKGNPVAIPEPGSGTVYNSGPHKRVRRGNPKGPGDVVGRSGKSFLFCMSVGVPWNPLAGRSGMGGVDNLCRLGHCRRVDNYVDVDKLGAVNNVNNVDNVNNCIQKTSLLSK